MRYQGGKRRSAKYIAPVLARMSAAAPVRDIGDLFIGSAGIEQACVTLAPVTLGEVARISMILDPDGNWIELSRRASIVGSLSDDEAARK